ALLIAQRARAMVSAGADTLANAGLKTALALARGVRPNPTRARALDVISQLQLAAGDLRGAELTGWMLEPRYLDHPSVLADVAVTHLLEGSLGEAERVAGLIRLDALRERTLARIWAARRRPIQ
ncbi:MAG: hypothetical protein ACI9OJ_005962, partial [Myxococcota bacterium]